MRSVNFGDDVNAEALPSHLADCLRGVQARSVVVEADRVLFRGGAFRFFVSRWNVLSSFGFGDLTVDADRRHVQYRLSFRQLVLSVTALTLGITVIASFESRSWHLLAPIPFFGSGWLAPTLLLASGASNPFSNGRLRRLRVLKR